MNDGDMRQTPWKKIIFIPQDEGGGHQMEIEPTAIHQCDGQHQTVRFDFEGIVTGIEGHPEEITQEDVTGLLDEVNKGKSPLMTQLELISTHNATVRTAIQAMNHGWMSQTEALAFCVIGLAHQHQALQANLALSMQRNGPLGNVAVSPGPTAPWTALWAGAGQTPPPGGDQ